MQYYYYDRFFGLSLSFKIVSEQARALGKRLVGVLRDDRLGFSLEVSRNTSTKLCFRVFRLSVSIS